MTRIKAVLDHDTRAGKIADLLAEFGSPRVTHETEVCE